MNLFEAQTLAVELIDAHNLYGWKFRWNRCKTTYGVCCHTDSRIELSEYLTPSMNVDAVKNTILHEIAHALVGSGHGHNCVWRMKALEIGCDGNRTNNHEVSILAKYVATCPMCGHIHQAHRKRKRSTSCDCNGKYNYYQESRKLIYIQQY